LKEKTGLTYNWGSNGKTFGGIEEIGKGDVASLGEGGHSVSSREGREYSVPRFGEEVTGDE